MKWDVRDKKKWNHDHLKLLKDCQGKRGPCGRMRERERERDFPGKGIREEGQEESRRMLCKMHEMMLGIFPTKNTRNKENVYDKVKFLVVARREQKISS